MLSRPLACVFGTMALAASAALAAVPPADQPSAPAILRAQLNAALQRLGSGTPTATIRADVNKLLDLELAFGNPDLDSQLLIDLTATRRMVIQLDDPKNKDAKELTPFLLANPDIATTLALAMRADDDAPGAYRVLKELRDRFPKDVVDGANCAPLVAAICVVYDKPRIDMGLDKLPAPAEPAAVFEFFRTTRDQLQFRDKLPAELLTHVVNVHASIDDLRWAQKAYAGNTMVGKLYSSIMYDTAAFKFGKEKKVFKDGYTLPNIKKVGGVCVERAYFASEVGKAIGVPTVVVTGDGSDVGHAWVGYLKNAGGGGRADWDFSEGRFGEYKQGEGKVEDPQSGSATSDAFVGLSELLVGVPKSTIRTAVARTDAALRLEYLAATAGSLPTSWPTEEQWGKPPTPPSPARVADAASALAMLREAVTSCPGYERAWRELAGWSKKGTLNAAQKKEWSQAVLKIAERDRPDFAFAMLSAMIESAAAGEEQSKLWDWAASEFQRRPDLVSAARLAQGRTWEQAGDNGRAWNSYKDIITKFPNDGRSIIKALNRAESLLAKNGKDGAVLGTYEDAFRRISKPQQMSPGFETASNYYRVGERYAELLEAAGKKSDADRVRKQIGGTEKKGFGK